MRRLEWLLLLQLLLLSDILLSQHLQLHGIGIQVAAVVGRDSIEVVVRAHAFVVVAEAGVAAAARRRCWRCRRLPIALCGYGKMTDV